MSMIKYGRCDICGKKTFHLKRRYYRYSFPCGCCGRDGHHEEVFYCEKCKPEPRKLLRVVLDAETAEELDLLWKEKHNGSSNR